MPVISRKVKITGIVQGVSYRAWTEEIAAELKLYGWVRNCDDGSVEARLEGPEEVVNQMTARLKQGPKYSEVKSVEIIAEEKVPEGAREGQREFRIIRGSSPD